MKQNRIVCPSCGSTTIHYNGKTNTFHCSFCQTEFMMEDERKISDKKSISSVKYKNTLVMAVIVFVLVFAVIITVIQKRDNTTRSTLSDPVSPTMYPTQANAEVDEEKDVFKRLLPLVFQCTYGEITKEQVESIRFLGFYRGYSSVTVQIGFEDFFTYRGDDFSNTITSYELKNVEEEYFIKACEELDMFTQITVFETDYPTVDADMLSVYPNLKGLALEGNENPYFLSSMTQLKSLYLEGVTIREYIQSLVNLESLTLVGCDLDRCMSWMSGFTKLKKLCIRQCEEIEPFDYQVLSTLKNLSEVSFNNCIMYYEINDILAIPKLEILDLSGSEFYIDPKKVTLPNTLKSVILDNVTIHDYAYETMGDSYRYVQKNDIPVETIQHLLMPSN